MLHSQTNCCRFCFVDLVNASDMETALKLSGREFKGNALKIEVSKSQPETPGKTQEKSGKPGKAGKAKPGGQEQSDSGKLAFYWHKQVARNICFTEN